MADKLQEQRIKISWHGHSCFQISAPTANIVFDPYLEVPGYKTLDLQADIVLPSHEHDDHNARQLVKLSGRAADFNLEVISSYHDAQNGELRGENKIQIVTIDGKRIAHLGDLGHMLNDEQIAKLQDLDLLMIPVGGYYTIDARTAAELVQCLHPDLVIPMHYRDGKAGFEQISQVDPFLDLCSNVIHHDKSAFYLGDFHDCVLVLKNPKI